MKKIIAVAILVLVVITAGVAYWRSGAPEPAPPATSAQTDQSSQPAPAPAKKPAGPKDNLTSSPANTVSPAKTPAPKGFCERDFSDDEARKADASDLQITGGLVYIFEREARLKDPYGCADYYLDHDLDIDAVDPREDHEPITGLFFAIQRNDPKMVNFLIDHGADLKKRAGKNDVKPMGYAYFLALSDTRINRNEIIGILDDALTKQAKAKKGGDAAR